MKIWLILFTFYLSCNECLLRSVCIFMLKTCKGKQKFEWSTVQEICVPSLKPSRFHSINCSYCGDMLSCNTLELSAWTSTVVSNLCKKQYKPSLDPIYIKFVFCPKCVSKCVFCHGLFNNSKAG